MTPMTYRPSDRSVLRASAIVVFAALTTPPGVALAQSQQDLLFFLSVEGVDSSSTDNVVQDDSGFEPAVDILYTFSGERVRVLGEYFYSDEENEFERLQVGWRLGGQTMVWLGRFHQPGKYWTTEYHHGQLMQTSISRPGIEEWEDDGGVIPSHVTGMLVESEYAREDSSGFEWALSAGRAPQLETEGLHALEVLDGGSGHDSAVNFRFSYGPDIYAENRVGLLGGRSDIRVDSDSPAALNGLSAIEQTTLGIYVDWRWGRWRLISSLMRVDNRLKSSSGANETDRFLSGYFQAEHNIRPDWTLFARAEDSRDEEESEFLRLFPAPVTRRGILGVRWDIAMQHSLTLEINDTSRLAEPSGEDQASAVRLQWSAVFP